MMPSRSAVLPVSAVNYSFILLTMSYCGDRYISHLSFDDPNFCP
jgi:hypothetical protein